VAVYDPENKNDDKPDQPNGIAQSLGQGEHDAGAAPKHDSSTASPGQLNEAETSTPGADKSESSEASIPFNNNDKGKTGGIRSSLGNAFNLKGRRKQALVGGGIGGIIIALIFGLIGLSSLELVNLKENSIGRGNAIVNKVLNQRRNKAVATVLKKMSVGDFEESINNPKMQSSFEKHGFNLEFDEEGKLTHFEYTSSEGETRAFNPRAPDLDAETEAFFAGSAGAEAKDAIGKAIHYDAATWRGKAATALWERMGVTFKNIFNRTPSEKAETDEAKLADDLRNADDIATPEEVSVTEVKPAEDLEPKDAKGNPVSGSSATDTSEGLSSGKAEEFEQKAKADPNYNPDISLGNDSELANAANTAASGLRADSEQAGEELVAKLAAQFPGLVAEGAVKGVQLTGALQVGCRVRGTLNFVANVRNVMLSLELARFALRFLTAADNQKAGIIQGDGLRLLLLYMHRPNPSNGKAYAQSGGIQTLMGNSNAQINPANLSRYSVGRSNNGVLGQISDFVNSVPGVNNKTACSIANNGLVQIGSAVVGLGFAIFGGSETGISEFLDGTTIGLTIAQELVFQIGTPLLIHTGAHLVFNGFENGEMVGDGLASGIGALQGMNAGANGLRPATKAEVATIQKEVDADQKVALAKQSIFDRYLGAKNPDSLLSRLAVSIPPDIFSLMDSGIHFMSTAFTPNGALSSLANLFMPRSVRAATANGQCNDPQIVSHDLQADAFCNIVMAHTPNLDIQETEAVLKQTKQIDEKDNPVPSSEFDKYIKDCFSGRTGILYNPEVSENGTNDPNDNSCVEAGSPFPGDNVGRNDRFTTYYGYIVDRENIVQDVNKDFTNGAAASTSKNIYVLGDSLTAGMRDSGNLAQTLQQNGWNPTIQAECGRHLVSDGSSCAPGPVLGGMQQVDQPADKAAIKDAGVVVIGLGTNDAGSPSYGNDVSTLIGKVKALNPSAKIYWTNLYATDGNEPAFQAMDATLSSLSSSAGFTVIDWASQAVKIGAYAPGTYHPNNYPGMADFIINSVGAAK
jgi:lysophospholipase L1-like esterase